ncbi:transposable element Tcb2 transposase [Trichonephila clavipes]|nr:transposable element Tcb2 transposase [Trichonephila clavipes]
MIEELHRPLKSAIKCHATERWTEILPIILLGLRASLKEDILCTPAELVFGTTIRLPGGDDCWKQHMFLRRDMLRRPLQQPYDGPFKVLQRKDKSGFSLTSMKRGVLCIIDRCKPAFFLNTEDLQLPQTKNETPATVEPNATASTPATVESDPTASLTPTQPSGLTRSVAKLIFQLGIIDTGRRTGGTRNKPHSFVKGHNTEGLVGWYGGGISIGGRTDLHIIRNGTLTSRRYADEILRPHVIPYAGAIGDSFVFQDDNARPHRARLVENMLEAETIQRMEWPACSPDLNPIEHVWDMFGRRIAARPRPPATVRDLEIALLEEWNSIPQSLIDNLIASMANRCAAVLAVRGDHTPY